MTTAAPRSVGAPPALAFLLVQAAAVCVFAGRAWQHLFWDAPFRTLLWDQAWMEPLVSGLFGTPWADYARSPGVDEGIQTAITVCGALYAALAVLALLIRRVPRAGGRLLWLGSLLLATLAFLYWKEKFWNLGQFLEYALQICAPLLLYHLRYRGGWSPAFVFTVKVLIAVTFVCHGLYAVGYYPRPGNFVQMILDSLAVSEATALRILDVAGYLDFALAVGIFLPRRIALPFLYYAAIWGFLTAFARIYANFYPAFWQEALHQHLHQVVLRLPHVLVPLALIVVLRDRAGAVPAPVD